MLQSCKVNWLCYLEQNPIPSTLIWTYKKVKLFQIIAFKLSTRPTILKVGLSWLSCFHLTDELNY